MTADIENPTMPGAEWLERLMRMHACPEFRLTKGQQRCAQTLWDMTRIYNIPTPCDVGDAVAILPDSISMLSTGEMSTCDGEQLTRLVLAAHRHQVRVAVRAWTPACETPNAADRRRLIAIAEYFEAEHGLDLTVDDPSDVSIMSAGVIELHLTARGADQDILSHHPTLEDLAASIMGTTH